MQNRVLREELATLKPRLEAAEAAESVLKTEAADHRATAADLQAELGDLQGRFDSQRKAALELENSLEEARARSMRMREDLGQSRQVIGELTEERDRLAEEGAALKSRLKRFQGERDEARVANEELQVQIEALKTGQNFRFSLSVANALLELIGTQYPAHPFLQEYQQFTVNFVYLFIDVFGFHFSTL